MAASVSMRVVSWNNVRAAGQRVLALLAMVAYHVDLAMSLGELAVLHRGVDAGDDGRLARLAGFKQFHHAQQTAGDVFGLGVSYAPTNPARS